MIMLYTFMIHEELKNQKKNTRTQMTLWNGKRQLRKRGTTKRRRRGRTRSGGTRGAMIGIGSWKGSTRGNLVWVFCVRLTVRIRMRIKGLGLGLGFGVGYV
jgi:hypothetical protein